MEEHESFVAQLRAVRAPTFHVEDMRRDMEQRSLNFALRGPDVSVLFTREDFLEMRQYFLETLVEAAKFEEDLCHKIFFRAPEAPGAPSTSITTGMHVEDTYPFVLTPAAAAMQEGTHEQLVCVATSCGEEEGITVVDQDTQPEGSNIAEQDTQPVG
jgi:hypothetical protein